MNRLKRIAVTAAQAAMLAQAVMWTVFAVMRLIELSGSMDMVLAILMFANAAAFAVLGCLFKKRRLLLKISTLAFLFVNMVLTFTDQMGVYDWIVLGLNIISLGGCLALYTEKSSDKKVR